MIDNRDGLKQLKYMKTYIIKSLTLLLILYAFHISIYVKGKIPLQYSFPLIIIKILSDTYGGGNLLSGEFTISKSWYGGKISFGHFQSQSTFIYKIVT